MSEIPAVKTFGISPRGEPVEVFTLTGPRGLQVDVMTLGGIVTRLCVPDGRGVLADVVLGFDSLASYLEPHPYFGAIAGRVAGRITNARFTLDGSTYPLATNDPPNHLHGGTRGFDKQIWRAEPAVYADGSMSLRLSRTSPDGEEGYPGNVHVGVTYTVSASNELIIDSEATADRATPFSLTHHSYFNLAGEGSGSVGGHQLQLFSSTYAPADQHFGLIGRREPVNQNDFREPSAMSDKIERLHGRHGDLYFVDRPDSSGNLVNAARLVEPTSGRAMTVSTTEDCIQLYTGVGLDVIGKAGKRYGPFAGMCLECEGYPDGANQPALGDIILRPGITRQQRTVYAFSTV